MSKLRKVSYEEAYQGIPKGATLKQCLDQNLKYEAWLFNTGYRELTNQEYDFEILNNLKYLSKKTNG